GLSARAFDEGEEDGAQRLRRLQRAQARRVRRRDVDDEIVSDVFQRLERIEVVARRLLLRGVFVFSEVEPQGAGTEAEPGVAARGGGGARVVEAHAVDEGARARQPEEARPGIARLRTRGDGPDLHGAEAEREKARGQAVALVESRGDPDRGWKIEPAAPNVQARIGAM